MSSSRRLFAISFTICLFGTCAVLRAQEASSLQLVLESPSTELAVGEPIKLQLTLRNAGADVTRIVSIADLEPNSDYLHFEVNDGKEAYQCVTRFIHTHSMFDPVYRGEPLQPGHEVVTFLYPTRVWRREKRGERWGDLAEMFPSAGTYRIRAVYTVSPAYLLLAATAETGIRSNEIELTFREPDDIERRILAACSPGGDIAAHLGEMNAHAEFDEAALRAVLRDYPTHPMSNYARLCLARTLARISVTGVGPGVSEAATILEDLRTSAPEFRAEEVSKHLATAYYYLGERDASLRVFEELLEKYPYMRQHYSFMNRYILALTGDDKAPSRWNQARKNGKRGLEFLEE